MRVDGETDEKDVGPGDVTLKPATLCVIARVDDCQLVRLATDRDYCAVDVRLER